MNEKPDEVLQQRVQVPADTLSKDFPSSEPAKKKPTAPPIPRCDRKECGAAAALLVKLRDGRERLACKRCVRDLKHEIVETKPIYRAIGRDVRREMVKEARYQAKVVSRRLGRELPDQLHEAALTRLRIEERENPKVTEGQAP